MSFNSLEFLFFLTSVFILYWFIFNRAKKFRNFFILIISYYFYGCWDWRFLSLIIISSAVDYFVGQSIYKTKNAKAKKYLLFISIAVNLTILGFFKYYNFFIENFISFFSILNYEFNLQTLKIILPIGISFYTFQTMSYTIDIYKKTMKPTNDLIAFFAFVSFFPQLVAGPIERASNLLPQFYKKHNFNYNLATNGLKQILWGFFKKIVIADNCAIYVNLIFNDPYSRNGSEILIASILFAFQIYGDFSGYSDIAIGSASLFGFKLKTNFLYPYFSRDIAEFWRRWHISLSTWFRDYVYIPLGGSNGKK